MSIATVRRDSPCGCPLSAKPIQRFKQADKPRFLNFCKVKASDSTNIYNQASNSRAAVFDKPTKRGEGTACAASRTSPYCLSEASLRANVPSCLLSSTSYVLRHGVRGVSGRSPEFAFLLQAFSFSNKKKMRNAGSVKYFLRVGSEGNIYIFSLTFNSAINRHNL